MRMVQISLEHGLCAVSSVAFALYGMLLVGKCANVQEGIRMGNLCFKILDRFKAKAWIPRVHAAVYGFIRGWTKDALEPLLRGYRVGLETGDIELRQISQDYHRYISDVVVAHHQRNTMILMNFPFISTVCVLMGDATEFEPSPIQMKLNWTDFQRVAVAIVFCDYKQALRLVRAFLHDYPYEGYDMAALYLNFGIENIALCKESGRRNRRMRTVARRCLKNVDRICRYATEFCLGRLTLLHAEMSSQSSRHHEATVRKYLAAIALADASGNLFLAALGNERFGRYMGEHGGLSHSLPYLRIACSLYIEWNAFRKVEMLQGEIDRISILDSSHSPSS